METLTGRTARAVRWRFAGTVVSAAFQFGVGVLLARLLPPADFGLVALASIVLGVLRPLSDLGVSTALIRKPELTDGHVRTAFTLSVLLGFGIAAALATGAPLGAIIVGDAHVTPILQVLAAALAFRSVGVVAEALLARRLEFKQIFFIESGTSLVGYGGVAVALAYSGYGVWSLVWGSVVQAVLMSCAQLLVVRHSIRPRLRATEAGHLLQVGIGASLGSWVNYLALNGDNFVVGRWIGAASLGLYGRAYALMNLPFACASGAISGVLLPAFAQVQEEPARLRRGFLLATQLTAIVAAPSMATLAVAAPHLVPVLYGDAWVGVVAPLQILCVAGYFRALYHLGGIVLRSVGRVYRELFLQVVYAILVIGGSVGAARYGLPWVAAAVSAAILYMFLATTALALNVTGASWALYLRAQRSAVVTGLVTGIVALVARGTLEASGASGHVIAVGILAAASVPWSVGILRNLGQPEFKAVRAHVPIRLLRLAAFVSWRAPARSVCPVQSP
jgi:teichuronic acid exporter